MRPWTGVRPRPMLDLGRTFLQSVERSPQRWGQRVVAFVKRKAPVSAEALDAHCRGSTLADFKRPREYVFVREIPRSPVGKILRRKLVAGEYELDT